MSGPPQPLYPYAPMGGYPGQPAPYAYYPPRTKDPRRKWRIVGGILVLVAALLVIASIAYPMWTYTASVPATSDSSSVTVSVQLFLGSTVQVFAWENGQYEGGTTTPYTNPNVALNQTGAIYGDLEALPVIGLIFGLIAGSLGVASFTRARALESRYRIILVLTAVTVVFAMLAPAILVAEQPGALSKDALASKSTSTIVGIMNLTSPAPTTSFWGSSSCNYKGVCANFSVSWGAGVGWYLCIASAVLAIVGLLILFVGRPRPEQETTWTSPEGTADGTYPAYPQQGPPPAWGGYTPTPTAPPPYGYPQAPPTEPYLGAPPSFPCPSCQQVSPPGSPRCTNCGWPLT